MGADVASERNVVGTFEEIIMSYTVPELFSRKRRREISQTNMMMKALHLRSHFSGLHMSRFTSSPEDVYFPCGEFESNNTNDNVMHHVAFASTVSDTLLENLNVCDNDYSFLRIGRDDFTVDVEPIDPLCLMA